MDHLCLNCKSMEQTGCECPCECSLYSSSCTQQNTDNLKSCPPLYEQGSSLQTPWIQPMNLKSCPSIDCKSYTTKRDCLGVADCQWCYIDTDGETPLQQPFCSDVSVCFKGIFGSLIPFNDGSYSKFIFSFLKMFYLYKQFLYKTKSCVFRFTIDGRNCGTRVAVSWTSGRRNPCVGFIPSRRSILLQITINALGPGASVSASPYIARHIAYDAHRR